MQKVTLLQALVMSATAQVCRETGSQHFEHYLERARVSNVEHVVFDAITTVCSAQGSVEATLPSDYWVTRAKKLFGLDFDEERASCAVRYAQIMGGLKGYLRYLTILDRVEFGRREIARTQAQFDELFQRVSDSYGCAPTLDAVCRAFSINRQSYEAGKLRASWGDYQEIVRIQEEAEVDIRPFENLRGVLETLIGIYELGKKGLAAPNGYSLLPTKNTAGQGT